MKWNIPTLHITKPKGHNATKTDWHDKIVIENLRIDHIRITYRNIIFFPNASIALIYDQIES